MTRRRRAFRVVLFLGLVAGLALLFLLARTSGREFLRGSVEETPEVDVVAVEEIVLDGVIEAEVTIASETETLLVAPDVGRVAALAKVGDRLARGAIVVRLDLPALARGAVPAPPEAPIPVMAGEVARLEARLRRLEALEEIGAVARNEVTMARDELAAARQAARPAAAPPPERRPVVRRHVVRALFDAVVLERFVALGEMVAARTPLVRLGRPDALRLVMHVDSDLALHLRAGMPVTLIRGGSATDALLTRIDAVAASPDSFRTVRVVLATPAGLNLALETGTFEARITTEDQKRAFFAPSGAIQTDSSGRRLLWVLRGDRVEARPVRVGYEDEARVEILEGIAGGDSIVRHPARARLRDGMTVRVR